MRLVQSSETLTVHAPAKVNLFLKILGKRPDGFHEIETVMASLSLADTLVLRHRDDGQITFRCRLAAGGTLAGEGTFTVPEDESNLVVRAAELLKEQAAPGSGADFLLWKRIPVGAGLGGGSSDAAAALAGLNRIWNLGLSVPDLMAHAGKLGSDVAFFLADSPLAICRGRGEHVEPCRIPNVLNFVVLRPQSGLSTAEVYGKCRPDEVPQTALDVIERLSRGNLGQTAYVLHNGLQPVAEQLNGDVRAALTLFRRLRLPATQMSGSGTAVFGLCSTWEHARHVASRLAAQGIGRVFAAQCRP